MTRIKFTQDVLNKEETSFLGFTDIYDLTTFLILLMLGASVVVFLMGFLGLTKTNKRKLE